MSTFQVFGSKAKAKLGGPLACVTALLLAGACGSDDATAPEPAAPKPTIEPQGPVVQPTLPRETSLSAIWGSGPDDVWAVGPAGAIMHFDGSELHMVESGVDVTLLAVHGTGPDDVWFVGEQGTTLHWDGTKVHLISQTFDRTFLGVWANGADDVWLVGFEPLENVGIVRHWDGTEWAQISIPTARSLWEVWSSGRDDVWMVGTSMSAGGVVLHAVGGEITQIDYDGTALRGVWGSSAEDVWVLPYESPLQHWDGQEFSETESDAEFGMLGMWGLEPDDVWAVGLNGQVLHYDGANWKTSLAGTDLTLWSVWGSAPDDVWVVGGTLLRWNGTEWIQLKVAGG